MVALSNATDPKAIATDREVRITIAPGDLWRISQRLRQSILRDPVNPLIFPVGKINRDRPYGINPAAVFVLAGTSIESRRNLVALLAAD